MDDAEYEGWQDINRLCWATRALSPCVDCTKAFAAAMRAQDRCDSQPGTVGYTKPATRAETIAALYRDGYTQKAIAQTLGVSRSTVWEHLNGRLNGAGERRTRTAQERRAAIVRLSAGGARAVDIARQVGVSESYVRRHRVRAA
jgi:DNA-binding NarL/FixJ family response regulator